MQNEKRRWTNQEIEYVRKNLGNVSMKYIAQKINRTPTAIMAMVTKLKLGGPIINTEYLLPNIAAKMIGVGYNNLIYWINHKELKIEEKAIKSQKRKLINYDDFINFLKNNQDLWDSRKVEPYALGFEPLWLQEKRKLDRKKPRNSQLKWSTFDEIKAERMRKEGKSIQEIADTINRSYASVKRKLYDLRIKEKE